MSRQLGRLLFLLALWLQFLAPVVAAQRQPTGDGSLAGVPICGHAAFGTTENGAGPDEHHGGAVPLCGLCCAAAAVLDVAPPGAVAVPLVWMRFVFAASDAPSADTVRIDRPRARGPPALV